MLKKNMRAKVKKIKTAQPQRKRRKFLLFLRYSAISAVTGNYFEMFLKGKLYQLNKINNEKIRIL